MRRGVSAEEPGDVGVTSHVSGSCPLNPPGVAWRTMSPRPSSHDLGTLTMLGPG